MEHRKRTRRGTQSSREAMHAMRAKPPPTDPCPPGPKGGQYKPLSDHDCQSIMDTSVRILEEIGMGNLQNFSTIKQSSAVHILMKQADCVFPE